VIDTRPYDSRRFVRPIITSKTDLSGLDLRLPALRREVFLRVWEFNTRHRIHPGCVHFLIPALRDTYGWDDESFLWFLFINGQTQNPAMTLLIHTQFPTPADAPAAAQYVHDNYKRLDWDMDRRYQKAKFGEAVGFYLNEVRRWGSQRAFLTRDSWDELWEVIGEIPGMGRLAIWSYLEYLYIGQVHDYDAPSLMLNRTHGSKSHRNGLCIVTGNEVYDHHKSNPNWDGRYSPELIEYLHSEGELLLSEARSRMENNREVGRLTLESTLCTYKSFWRVNRRYPGVYADMLYDRIRKAQSRFPEFDFGSLWSARAAYLPEYLRAETYLSPDVPTAVSREKQNHYRLTGRFLAPFSIEFPDMGV